MVINEKYNRTFVLNFRFDVAFTAAFLRNFRHQGNSFELTQCVQ